MFISDNITTSNLWIQRNPHQNSIGILHKKIHRELQKQNKTKTQTLNRQSNAEQKEQYWSVEIRGLVPVPNSWDSTCQAQPLTPRCQIKRQKWWRAEKGDLLRGLGHAIERGNVRTEHIFSHLPGTEMS
jgi:hypothetical protein